MCGRQLSGSVTGCLFVFASCLCTLILFCFLSYNLFSGKSRAARPGRRAGTTSKKIESAPYPAGTWGQGWEGKVVERSSEGRERVWVISMSLERESQGEGTWKTWSHLPGSPNPSYLIFAFFFLFRALVERGGNRVPQGNQAPRYGMGGQSRPLCLRLSQSLPILPS